MMDKTFEVKIITTEKVVFSGRAEALYARGIKGEFGILKDHAPFVSVLNTGVLKIVNENAEEFFAVIGGILKFENNVAVVLSEYAESGKDIDETEARMEKEKQEARKNAAKSIEEARNADKALALALAKLKAATAHKG